MPTPPSPPYLSHVANDNRHDDAVDGHSLTEDDAGSGSRGLGGGEEKELRKKPTFLPEESPATSPPLTSDPNRRLVRSSTSGRSNTQAATNAAGSDHLTRVLHLPDQVLGLNPGGLHPSPNDGRASDIDAPGGRIRNQ